MKYTFLLVFLPAIIAAQSVVFSHDTIINDGSRFIRQVQIAYDNGQKTETATSMDSLTLTKTYETGIRQAANQVSESNILSMGRRQAAGNFRAESARISNLSGANILDSIGFGVFEKLKNLEWVLSGIDTIPLRVEIGRNQTDFYITIKKSAFRVFFYADNWIQIPDLYGKGIDQDLFLWRGAFVSPDYRIILSATGIKSVAPAPTTVSHRKNR